ncbi:MAG: Gfo/Idh/MocA family protein [Candidatus Zipacnadales bacterium]
MEPLSLMLVGCGMMGARHLRGYYELERVQPGSLKLLAVCDPIARLANGVADEAQELLGYRPAVYPSPQEALTAHPAIEAADIVTDNRSHDTIAIPLFEAGLHLLIEKPLGLTMARAQSIIRAAKQCDRVLAVAENNRRDPMNRLCRHIISSGMLGQPNLVLQTSVSPGRRIIASPWRHAMSNGGLALDVGIHLGYVLEMLLGPIDTIYALSRQVWPTRWGLGPDGSDLEYAVESDDVFTASLAFESGVQGTWVMHFGAIGGGVGQRTIFGTLGTLEAPADRSGRAPIVKLEGETLEGNQIIERLPEFRLNEVEALLWGERPANYSLPYPETDRKLIAAEVADFVAAIRTNRSPEVPGELGLRSVAVVYTLLEAAASRGPVKVADVLAGKVCAVQQQVKHAE